MKKPLIAAIATLAVAAGAQAESKFYGKMNVSVAYDEASEKFGVNSHASRLGVKGSDDLGGSKVIYQAEYETAPDDGDATGGGTAIKQRDIYVGLAYDGMGTVKMGMMDTPLKKSQGKFDLFNDVFDFKRVLDGENRVANSLNYTTEKMGGVQVSASAVLAEDGSSDGYSANATFKSGGIYAGVAYDTKIKQESVQRVTVIYNMGDMTVGALINNVDTDDVSAGDDELGYAVNASMKAGKNTIKLQYEAADQKSTGVTSLSVGVDHKLGKATKAFAYINQSESDLSDANAQLALGLVHKF